MQKTIGLVLVVLLSAYGCKNGQTTKEEFTTPDPRETAGVIPPGKKLMETKCYVCHSPDAPENEGRIGPPMIAIKAHYIDEETTKEEFIAALWDFVEKPTEEKARMRGAVRRFGVMPYQPFPREEIEQIGAYIFDYRIEEPEWFMEHWMNGHGEGHEQGMGQGKGHGKGQGKGQGRGRGGQRKPYINSGKTVSVNEARTPADIGLKYALDTKKLLGKNLMGAIQSEGTLAAVKFCNVEAYPLTDSVSKAYNAVIKRVSDRPRNPDNQANAEELARIAAFKKTVAVGGPIEPVVVSREEEHRFYYPITTNTMCLQCHGTPGEQVEPEVMASLKELYPMDQALGYDVNQVRGIWSISLKNK